MFVCTQTNLFDWVKMVDKKSLYTVQKVITTLKSSLLSQVVCVSIVNSCKPTKVFINLYNDEHILNRYLTYEAILILTKQITHYNVTYVQQKRFT